MEFSLNSKLDKAIEKYGDGDQNYQQQLKKEVRNFMGYQNFIDKANENLGKEPDVVAHGKVRPQASVSLLQQGANRRAGEVDHYLGMADKANQAGESLASSMASNRASGGGGSGEQGFNQDFVQKEPENWLERELQDFYMNPFDESGQMKDVEALKKDLITKKNQIQTMRGEAPGEGSEAYGDTPETKLFSDEEINQKVEEVIGDPEQFQKNHYKALGFSDTIAEKMYLTDKVAKGDFSPAVEEIIRAGQPGVYDDAMIMRANKDLIKKKELQYKKTKMPDGQEQKNLEMAGGTVDYATLRSQHPNVPEKDLKRMMEPTYELLARDDISTQLKRNAAEYKGLTIDEFLDRSEIKNLKVELQGMYRGMFQSSDIEGMLIEEFNKLNIMESEQKGGGSGYAW
jgi:hypothetical protein